MCGMGESKRAVLKGLEQGGSTLQHLWVTFMSRDEKSFTWLGWEEKWRGEWEIRLKMEARWRKDICKTV
ncbi:hypothetical protein RRG08_039472 [Elysia crispata]|uniref:Uncharacterized protein n=1 Tax=Elysia crispata TaxID=231223 RepID=A0AAE0YK88_9GAST|nr:hypothetical protein RRG08_039472 [Elysia crispata]